LKIKIHQILTTTLTFFLLTSCVNRERNYFVAGKFEATNNLISYCLEINEISEDTYVLSNYTNVVEDKVNGKYFELEFNELDNDSLIPINLINLKDSNPNTKAVPISYIDDNGVDITPYYPHDIDNDYYYLIVYESLYLYFERIN